ncbi:iron complex transport system permease protein [Lutibacter agarilyticus]|uniref:Iron complex transport system permease protein n=1 Tax=Lutibacter agarilyticus TaxID=1109740 RepID=A0A238XM87_9FLAO|nr:iron ABC transporter permease [Lutibacter agarilyticus]SNR59708.1 iron complex transport system permease protein [Lutibacter agarilyticus]
MLNPIKSYRNTFIILVIVLLIICLINISLGSVSIPLKQLFLSLINGEVEKESWRTIILNYRLPKAITAIIVGSGLSISGLLMQTLFRNPLAGPFVLGISSGASLGVAILILGASFLGANITSYAFTNFGIAIAASLGSFIVLLAVMLAAIKVRNTMSILIIGLMFGSITSSVISVLAYFSSASELQQYMFWSFGSLGNLSWKEITALFSIFIIGVALVTFIIKPLNSMLLGENYAKSMGVNVKLTRNITLIATSLLTGVITAFSGPIAFVGLAVPHLTKLLFNTSNHKTLLPAVAICGAIVMLICDSIAQMPNSEYTLPINAITSLFGAPIIIWLLVRKRKIYY